MTTECTRTAPETIYLNIFCETDAPFPNNHEDITWCTTDVGDTDVCYTRADIAEAEIARLQAKVDALAGALQNTLYELWSDRHSHQDEEGFRSDFAEEYAALAAVGR